MIILAKEHARRWVNGRGQLLPGDHGRGEDVSDLVLQSAALETCDHQQRPVVSDTEDGQRRGSLHPVQRLTMLAALRQLKNAVIEPGYALLETALNDVEFVSGRYRHMLDGERPYGEGCLRKHGES